MGKINTLCVRAHVFPPRLISTVSRRVPAFQAHLPQGHAVGESGESLAEIGEWSNDMAKGMMTLEEEMEAFGEKMPAAQYDKNGDKENADPRREGRS